MFGKNGNGRARNKEKRDIGCRRGDYIPRFEGKQTVEYKVMEGESGVGRINNSNGGQNMEKDWHRQAD